MHTGNIEADNDAAMEAIIDGIGPSDRGVILALAADDRMWHDAESLGAGGTHGESLEFGVRWALRPAMSATDGVG